MATLAPDLLTAAQLAAFGEPVQLADGSEVVGIFEPVGRPAGGLGTEVGLTGRLSGQTNPTVALDDEVAAAIADGETLSIRGVAYVAVQRDPDGFGMTLCTLMPASRSGAGQLDRWR